MPVLAGTRNVISEAGADQDTGAGTPGIRIPPVDPAEVLQKEALKRTHLLQMMDDRSFDYSHPVDEYAPQGAPGPVQAVTVQPDYDMPERINAITYIIPAGTISASLQLGQRTITLYASPPVTAPAVPASTVAQQNTAGIPVQVVITGGTITAVVVNGITVGAAAGTYTVPAYGAISITYSVAPTWAWTALGLAAPLASALLVFGIILNSDDPRILTLTGTITSQPYVGLAGFALTRGQFS